MADTPEVAEDNKVSEDVAESTEDNTEHATVQSNSKRMMLKAAAGENPMNAWNSDRTQYFDENGNPVKGLFKAPRKDGGMGLFFANANGIVEKKETLYTAPSGKGFVHRSNSEGEWWDPVSSGVYSYLVAKHSDGEYYVHWQRGAVAAAGKYYYVQENGTVRTARGVQATGVDKYYIQDGGVIQTSSGIVTNTDGKKYYVQPNTNGKIRTTAGIFKYKNRSWYSEAGGAVREKQGVFKAANNVAANAA